MEAAVELAIPVDVAAPKLMGSEALVGARVCSTDVEARESSAVSAFPGPKIGECSSLPCYRGSEGKQIQRKMGKVPRNGSSSFKKLRMLQSESLLPQAEADDAKMVTDKLGLHLVKCSSADKSQVVKQRNSINGRRGDRRNCKILMKAKYDSSSLKSGLLSFSPAGGGSKVFGMYGLKPDVHDVSKLVDDISLDELLDGTHKRPIVGKDKENKATNVNDNILDSVRKAWSIIRLQGVQLCKQTEEVDIYANKKIPLPSSPSNTSVANVSDGDESSLTAGLSTCDKDQESSIKAEALGDMHGSSLYQPRDVLKRLALPPLKDLDSLLQDAVKPAASLKLIDSRFGKSLSHRVSLPSFSWSHNFNGHYKSNNDAIRIPNRSTCQGRWVRIKSSASFIEGGAKGFEDLDSLTYDGSLVPAGQLRYTLPEIEKTSSIFTSQHCYQEDSSSVVCPIASLLPPALHSPRVLAAAQTLCDIASHCLKHESNEIPKWPKQPSQKAMKARKSRTIEKPESLLTPKSGTLLDHVVRSIDYGSSSKKPKVSMVERREDFSHIHTVIGLSSVSAPRSNWLSPSRLSRDSVAEARQLNGSFVKPPFMVPPPPRVLHRSNHNPQKTRKVVPIDWNRIKN